MLLATLFILAATAAAVLGVVAWDERRDTPSTWSLPPVTEPVRDNSPEAMIARVLASLAAEEHAIGDITDVWPGKWQHGVCTCGHRVATAGSVQQAAAFIDAHARAKRQPRDAKGRFVKAEGVIDVRSL